MRLVRGNPRLSLESASSSGIIFTEIWTCYALCYYIDRFGVLRSRGINRKDWHHSELAVNSVPSAREFRRCQNPPFRGREICAYMQLKGADLRTRLGRYIRYLCPRFFLIFHPSFLSLPHHKAPFQPRTGLTPHVRNVE